MKKPVALAEVFCRAANQFLARCRHSDVFFDPAEMLQPSFWQASQNSEKFWRSKIVAAGVHQSLLHSLDMRAGGLKTLLTLNTREAKADPFPFVLFNDNSLARTVCVPGLYMPDLRRNRGWFWACDYRGPKPA